MSTAPPTVLILLARQLGVAGVRVHLEGEAQRKSQPDAPTHFVADRLVLWAGGAIRSLIDTHTAGALSAADTAELISDVIGWSPAPPNTHHLHPELLAQYPPPLITELLQRGAVTYWPRSMTQPWLR